MTGYQNCPDFVMTIPDLSVFGLYNHIFDLHGPPLNSTGDHLSWNKRIMTEIDPKYRGTGTFTLFG
jgi:hypothetical protein